MAELVHLHPIAGINKNRCADFLYDRGSFELIAGAESGAQIKRTIHRLTLENHAAPAALAAIRLTRGRVERQFVVEFPER